MGDLSPPGSARFVYLWKSLPNISKCNKQAVRSFKLVLLFQKLVPWMSLAPCLPVHRAHFGWSSGVRKHVRVSVTILELLRTWRKPSLQNQKNKQTETSLPPKWKRIKIFNPDAKPFAWDGTDACQGQMHRCQPVADSTAEPTAKQELWLWTSHHWQTTTVQVDQMK